MRAGRTSVTAQTVAWTRAVEAGRPPHERLFEDPLSAELLGPFLRTVAGACRLRWVRSGVVGSLDRLLPGSRGGILGRTRFIDEALCAALDRGIALVVLLGAGLDTRAYRIPMLARTAVFEVDHPDTQAMKRRGVARTFDGDPSHVTFVPIDFARQQLEDALAASGFPRNRRTFWIWEGVTEYISAEAVEATLRTVAAASAPDSRIAFTYTDRGAIDGSRHLDGAGAAIAGSRIVGERYVFGFDPAELPGYLAKRGFELLEDVSGPEYRERYFAPLRRSLRANDYERAALARRVASPAGPPG